MIGVFAIVLLGIIITEVVRHKPLNWSPSYTNTSKIPFGCYVLYNELPTLFPNERITEIRESPYETLAYRDTEETSSYLFINDGTNFDEQETLELLDYVREGNDVFIASTFFGSYLSDTLNIDVQSTYHLTEDSVALKLTNSSFSNSTFYYTRGVNKARFVSVDTANTTVLGSLKFGNADGEFNVDILAEPEKYETIIEKPNFIKTKYGKGNFYLNTTPQAFTNYYLLGKNQAYAANALSYLKSRPMYWDGYVKTGRIVVQSPLRFVLNQDALKWAYYLIMIGVLLFIIFKAKREQRIIPIIKPLENATVEFSKTVGSLYYQHKNYSDLIKKKLNYFLEYLRSHYYIDTGNMSEKVVKDLAAKSGKSITETKELIDFISYLKSSNTHTEQNMISLNNKITSFKQ